MKNHEESNNKREPNRPASSTSWILVAMWAGCVAVASPAYIAFKAKTGDTALALILFVAIAAMLCACAWQIYRQIDAFKGKSYDMYYPCKPAALVWNYKVAYEE